MTMILRKLPVLSNMATAAAIVVVVGTATAQLPMDAEMAPPDLFGAAVEDPAGVAEDFAIGTPPDLFATAAEGPPVAEGFAIGTPPLVTEEGFTFGPPIIEGFDTFEEFEPSNRMFCGTTWADAAATCGPGGGQTAMDRHCPNGICLFSDMECFSDLPCSFLALEAEETARRVWDDASQNFPFDFFGTEATCDWDVDDACVRHPTFRGGSDAAYDACRNSTIAAFADDRLDATVELHLLVDAKAEIGAARGDCASLLPASGILFPDDSAVEGAMAAWLDHVGNPFDEGWRPPGPTPGEEHGHDAGDATFHQPPPLPPPLEVESQHEYGLDEETAAVHVATAEPSDIISDRCLHLIEMIVLDGIDPDAPFDIMSMAESCCENEPEHPRCAMLACYDPLAAEMDGTCDCAAGVEHASLVRNDFLPASAMSRCCVSGENTDVDAFEGCLAWGVDGVPGFLTNPPALCADDSTAEACECLGDWGQIDYDCGCGVLMDFYDEDPLWLWHWGMEDAGVLRECCAAGGGSVQDALRCHSDWLSSFEDHVYDANPYDDDWTPVSVTVMSESDTAYSPIFEPVPENCTDAIMEGLFGFGVEFDESACCADHPDHPYCILISCEEQDNAGVYLQTCTCDVIFDLFAHPSFPDSGEAQNLGAYLASCCPTGETSFEDANHCLVVGPMANPPALCANDPSADACTCLSMEGYLDEGCDCGAMLDLYAEDPLWGYSWGVADAASLEACCDPGNNTVLDTNTCLMQSRDCGLFYGPNDDDDIWGDDDLEGEDAQPCCIPGNTTYGEATECLYGGQFYYDDSLFDDDEPPFDFYDDGSLKCWVGFPNSGPAHSEPTGFLNGDADKDAHCISYCWICSPDDGICTKDQVMAGETASVHLSVGDNETLELYASLYAAFNLTSCQTDNCNKVDACTGTPEEETGSEPETGVGSRACWHGYSFEGEGLYSTVREESRPNVCITYCLDCSAYACTDEQIAAKAKFSVHDSLFVDDLDYYLSLDLSGFMFCETVNCNEADTCAAAFEGGIFDSDGNREDGMVGDDVAGAPAGSINPDTIGDGGGQSTQPMTGTDESAASPAVDPIGNGQDQGAMPDKTEVTGGGGMLGDNAAGAPPGSIAPDPIGDAGGQLAQSVADSGEASASTLGDGQEQDVIPDETKVNGEDGMLGDNPAGSIAPDPAGVGGGQLTQPVADAGEPSASPTVDPLTGGQDQGDMPDETEATGDPTAAQAVEDVPEATTPPTKSPVLPPAISATPLDSPVDGDPDVVISNGAVTAGANIGAVTFVCIIIFAQKF